MESSVLRITPTTRLSLSRGLSLSLESLRLCVWSVSFCNPQPPLRGRVESGSTTSTPESPESAGGRKETKKGRFRDLARRTGFAGRGHGDPEKKDPLDPLGRDQYLGDFLLHEKRSPKGVPVAVQDLRPPLEGRVPKQ